MIIKHKLFVLELSSFADIVPLASHWHASLCWYDASGRFQREYAEFDVQHYPDLDYTERSRRFETKTAARAAGIAMAATIAIDQPFFVTEGSFSTIDPQPIIAGPQRLRSAANPLAARFRELGGWDGPKDGWPAIERDVCEPWMAIIRAWRA